MVNSGNRMPGSAVISVMFMDAMGIQDLLLPTDTRILMASEDGQPLQVIGKIRHLYMAVTDATSPPAGFTMAKRVALPARSITMVPV